jgi:hypothetical protein
MKLVFTREETATAIGKSVEEFNATLPALHAPGGRPRRLLVNYGCDPLGQPRSDADNGLRHGRN